MGSYNVACAISGLTIDCGEECGWVPLEFPKYRTYDTYFALGNDTLIGTEAIFSPASMPIWGSYYDYGYIQVEEALNDPLHLRIVRKMFGFKDDACVHNTNNRQVVSGAFVIKRIYDQMTATPNIDDYTGKPRSHNDGWFTSLYEEDTDKIRQAWKEMSNVEDFGDAMQRTTAERRATWRRIYSNSDRLWWREFGPTFGNCYMRFTKELHEELDRFRHFTYAMHSCNRMWQPAMNGEQHGNHFMSLKMLHAIEDVLVDKISVQYQDQDCDVPEFLLNERNSVMLERITSLQIKKAMKNQ